MVLQWLVTVRECRTTRTWWCCMGLVRVGGCRQTRTGWCCMGLVRVEDVDKLELGVVVLDW